jgi:putative oxidoreductase
MAFIITAYGRFLGLLAWLRWLPPLVARWAVGWTFFVSGKAHVGHIDGFTSYLKSLAIPHPHLNALATGYTEWFGGALLLVGLLTRFASIALIVVFSVAIATAKMAHVDTLDDFTFLPEFLSIALMLYLLVDGAGWLSLDQVASWLLGTAAKAPAGKGGTGATKAKAIEQG